MQEQLHDAQFMAVMITGGILMGLVILGLVFQVFNFVRTTKTEHQIKDAIDELRNDLRLRK